MPIVFQCPACRSQFQTAETSAGQMCRCPACGTVFQLPALAAAGPRRTGPQAPLAPGAVAPGRPAPVPPGYGAPVPASQRPTQVPARTVADAGLPGFFPPQAPAPASVWPWVIVGSCLLLVVLGVGGLIFFLSQDEPNPAADRKDPGTDAVVHNVQKPPDETPTPQKPAEPVPPRVKPRPNVKPLPVWPGHGSTVWTVAFSQDGSRALSGGGSIVAGVVSDNSVRLWDAYTGKQTKCLNKFHNFIKSVAFSPDGRYAIFANSGKWVGAVYHPSTDHGVRLWDVETDRELQKIVLDRPDAEAARTESVARFQGHTDEVWSVTFSPDSRRAAAGSRSGNVLVWDVDTGKLLCTCRRDNTGVRGHLSGVYALAFSPDGKRLVSASYDRTVRLWDAATGEHQRALKGHTDYVWSAVFSPDGRLVLSSAGGVIGQHEKSTNDHTIRLWNAETGEEIRRFTGHTSNVYQAVFAPDGRYVVSGSADRTVRVWDMATGNELRCFKGHTGVVRSVAVSPDGMYALSGGDDLGLRVWEMPAPAPQ